MFLPLLFSFLIWFVKSEKVNLRKRKSFTFVTSQNKEFTLQPAKNYLKKNENIFSRLSRRLRGVNKNEEGSWYYIHFIDDEEKEVRRVVNRLQLKVENGILKNTYIAYLREEELESLEEHALIKKVSPEEKFEESGGKITDTNYFHVITTEDTKIPSKQELFSIERQDDSRTYIIRVEEEGINEKTLTEKKRQAIRFLSEISGVRSISTFTRPTIKNNIMTGYTQRNQDPASIKTDSNSNLRYLPRYFNDQNLNGEGQIITIQDTPIDFYHAMFRDDNVFMELNKPLQGHRKLVYYGSKAQNLREWSAKLEASEHGTHVAGTTAGKSICQNDLNVGTSLFNGNAPDAKILYAGGLNDVSATQLGSLMQQYKSYISTNSWGVNGYNDQINYEYGNLALKNPDRLFLFAAGNEYSDGNFTVCDPGGSKNVLTVGAMGDFFNEKHTYRFEGQYGGSFETQALLDADPWIYGTLGKSTDSTIVAIDAAEGDQCNKINSGKVSVIYASNAQQIEWLYQCQLSSTSGILFSTKPSEVESLLNSMVRVTDVTQINTSAKITHADYSSGGPGNKGIQKPDIMTPGTRIFSAKSQAGCTSNHGCNTLNGGDFTIMQGTSMATPNAAGATALVREYFSKNRWNQGNVELDATTLRALMINSCKHPHGAKTPDALFGHGIVDLSTVLPLDGSFGVQITPQRPISSSRSLLAGQKPSVGKNSHVSATIQVTPNGKPLQITLSYLDEMLSANSPVPLTRDLDLVAISPSGRYYKGDHLSNGDTQHSSTNEKIIIDTPEAGSYTIHVTAGEFADDDTHPGARQEFAVVATGPVQNGFIEFAAPTTCPCPRCDSYNPLYCKCDKQNQIGYVCQAEIQDIQKNSFSVTVGPLQISRVFVRSDKEIKTIIAKSSNAGTGSTIWAAPQCYTTLGEYDVNGQTGGFFKKKTKVHFGTNELCVAVFNNNYQAATYDIQVSDKEGGLSKTNIIIIVVCIVAALAVGAVVIYCCCCKKRGDGGGGGGVSGTDLI